MDLEKRPTVQSDNKNIDSRSNTEQRTLTADAAVGLVEQINRRLFRDLSGMINSMPYTTDVLTELQIELCSTNTIVPNLENFFRRTNTVEPARTSLIPVQDVIVVMTELAKVYSELPGVLQQLKEQFKGSHKRNTTEFKNFWASNTATVEGLRTRLQRCKLNASLILQIISCDSQVAAEHIAEAVRNNTNLERESDVDLIDRLQGLELPQDPEFSSDDRDLTGWVIVSETHNASEGITDDPLQMREGSTSQHDIGNPSIVLREALDERPSNQRHHEMQAPQINDSKTTSHTGSRGWSVISETSSAQVSSLGRICLPLRESELKVLFRTILPQTRPSELETTFTNLEQQLRKILHDPWTALDMKGFMNLYNQVHDFCFGPSRPPGEHSRRPQTPGEELYILLRTHLSGYTKQVHAIAKTYSGDALLHYHNREWKKYKEAAKITNHVFRSLNRHWIKREQDEGRKNLYDIHTLHLLIWKSEVFENSWERLMQVVLQFLEKLRVGEVVDQGEIQTMVDSLISLSISFESQTKPPQLDLEVYRRHFEVPFLHATREYYQRESARLISENSVVEYISIVERRIIEEERIGSSLHPETMSKLMDICNESLLADHYILLQDGFHTLLENKSTDNLTRLYKLLCRTKSDLGPLKDQYEVYIQGNGSEQQNA